jgi:nucleoside-diphosphate-sugar epimerase
LSLRVLISGAGGFVGGRLAYGMSRRGHDVVALVRETRPAMLELQPGVRIEKIDLAQPGYIPVGPYDAILHCAAAIPSVVRNGSELTRINLETSRRMFDSAFLSSSTVIIFCSSMSVYGQVVDDMVDESTSIRDPDAYGRSKLECECLLDELCRVHSGIRALSIRLPGVVGVGSHDNFLSDIKARLVGGERVVIRNPEALFNNVVHIDDLERFVEHLLHALPVGHRVTTLASDHPLRIRAVAEILAAGRLGEVRYEQGGHPFLISNENARCLGYVPATVRDSVERFARN